MRTEYVTESVVTELSLTKDEVDQLQQLGRALASRKGWWGGAEDMDSEERSVIKCHQISDRRYRIKVLDAVGTVGVGDLQLIVRPKIPLPHLIFLLIAANQLPRTLSHRRTRLTTADNFFDVITHWFVDACEALLRQGLISDYNRTTGDLTCARGRIDALKTSRSLLAGRPLIHCDYDSFGENSSLNRTIKAAALRVLGLPLLPASLQRRCRRIVYRLSDVGELRVSDLVVKPEAISRRYLDAHSLAVSILASTGIALNSGENTTWTFLFRTPESVEEGLRNALREHLQQHCAVHNTSKILLGDRRRSLNPDLVFGNNAAVGDVKYRLMTSDDFSRPDVYQVAAFAIEYRVERAAIIAFTGTSRQPPWTRVGQLRIDGFFWNCSEGVPEQACSKLAEQLRDWLGFS